MRRRRKSLEFEQVTTRGGDSGESSIYSGERYRKDDLIFHTMGDIDELSSHIGLVKVSIRDTRTVDRLDTIQRTLITVGAEVATPKNHELFEKISHVQQKDIDTLEGWEKELLEDTPIESSFVLPGGNTASATADIARTICRRAERDIVACIRERVMGHLIPSQKYLNRLSDYLFILARALGKELII